MNTTNWKSLPTSGPDLWPEFERLNYWAQLKYDEVGPGRLAVEIGSFLGRSSAILSQYFEIICIDIWGGSDNSPFETTGEEFLPFIRNIRSLNLVDRAFPVVASSRFLEVVPPLRADFMFIDGDHHEVPCYNDCKRADRHLALHGMIAFHDFQRQGPVWPEIRSDYSQYGFPGVDRAVRRFLSERSNYKVLEHFEGLLIAQRTS